MKRIVCISLAILLFTNSAFAYGGRGYEDFEEYKSKYRILYGILLIVGGGILTYDGFRTVKIDISKPGLTFTSGGEWHRGEVSSPDRNYFIINSSGTVTNTGNVKIKQATAEVRYSRLHGDMYFPDQGEYGIIGVPIKFDSESTATILTNFAIMQTKIWEAPEKKYAAEMSNPPVGPLDTGEWQESGLVEIVNVRILSYEKKYKEEMNNVYEGIAGVLLFGAGAYLIIDYIVSLRKFDYYMKKNNIDFYVQNSADEFKLMFSKRIL